MFVRVPHFTCWCWPLGRGRRPQGVASQAPPSYRMALWDVQSAAHSGTTGPWLQLDGSSAFPEALAGAASMLVSDGVLGPKHRGSRADSATRQWPRGAQRHGLQDCHLYWSYVYVQSCRE